MTYSEIFNEYCRDSNERKKNPEKYMGPNYATIINFWSYLDKLTSEQWNVLVDITRKQQDVLITTTGAICNASYDTIESPGHVYLPSAWVSLRMTKKLCGRELIHASYAVEWATDEFIGMHKLLADGRTLSFIPLFDDLL